MKLLSGFNEEDMADKLLLLIQRKLGSCVKNEPIRLSTYNTVRDLFFEYRAKFVNTNWNSRYQQLALLKALISLSKRREIEFVSLRKTYLRHGFIHIQSGQPFELNLDQKILSQFGGLIRPIRYLKYGEWVG